MKALRALILEREKLKELQAIEYVVNMKRHKKQIATCEQWIELPSRS